MSTQPNPRLSNVRLDMHQAQDDAGQPMLHVESIGYYLVPAHVTAALNTILPQFPEGAKSEMATRFVLNMMLNNQAR